MKKIKDPLFRPMKANIVIGKGKKQIIIPIEITVDSKRLLKVRRRNVRSA